MNQGRGTKKIAARMLLMARTTLLLATGLTMAFSQEADPQNPSTPIPVQRLISEKLIGKTHPSWLIESSKLSLDGRRMAFVAKEDKKSFMVVDGKEGKRYDAIDWFALPIFSPDSKRVAYVARIGNKRIVVVEQRGKTI
jgi:hypothetical protein